MVDVSLGKIKVEDAIRLKHSLNKTITYRGHNTKEIRDMENLTKEQYSEVSRQLSEIKKSWWFFPDYVSIILVVVSGLCFFYFYQSFVRVAAMFVIAYCVSQLAYRAGVLYGYVRGYESGYEEGIHKALGVGADEAAASPSHERNRDVADRKESGRCCLLWHRTGSPRSNRVPDEEHVLLI